MAAFTNYNDNIGCHRQGAFAQPANCVSRAACDDNGNSVNIPKKAVGIRVCTRERRKEPQCFFGIGEILSRDTKAEPTKGLLGESQQTRRVCFKRLSLRPSNPRPNGYVWGGLFVANRGGECIETRSNQGLNESEARTPSCESHSPYTMAPSISLQMRATALSTSEWAGTTACWNSTASTDPAQHSAFAADRGVIGGKRGTRERDPNYARVLLSVKRRVTILYSHRRKGP